MNRALALGTPAPGWQARVMPGAFTSPGGVRCEFMFTAVARATEKRETEFQFADLNDSYVQQHGHGARKYPLVCLFSGADHDLLATRFEAAVLETGPGHLEHPLYGTFDAVSTGTIARRNDLVSEANQSAVEVTFSTTLASAYPATEPATQDEILAELEGFNAAAADDFERAADLSTEARRANLKSVVRDALNTVRGAFDTARGITAEARAAVADNQRLINESIDVLIGEPVLLIQAVQNLVLAPAVIMKGFYDRIAGYGLMIERMIERSQFDDTSAVDLPQAQADRRNKFFFIDALLMAAVSGTTLSTVDTNFQTRPQALTAAEQLDEQRDALIAWRDTSAATLETFDSGAAYESMVYASNSALGFLVTRSFELVPERVLVLERPRTIIDVCAQLYGTTSNARLDLLINSNNMGGDDLIELSRGFPVKYYVE